jgi:hypothetical protein
MVFLKLTQRRSRVRPKNWKTNQTPGRQAAKKNVNGLLILVMNKYPGNQKINALLIFFIQAWRLGV